MDLRKKRTIVINFLGAPSSGKTLLAALTFAELKLRGKVCEYVQEYAKTLVWLKKFELLNDQYFVSSHQNDLLRAIANTGKVDYIITDGPLLNGLYYNRYNPDNVSSVEKTEQFILDRYAEYDNFNVYLHRGDFPYEQEGRIQTLEQAKEIDRTLFSLLQDKEIPVMEISSSPESVKLIVDTILGVSQPRSSYEVPKPPLVPEVPKPPLVPEVPKPPLVPEVPKPQVIVELPNPPKTPLPPLTPMPPMPPMTPVNEPASESAEGPSQVQAVTVPSVPSVPAIPVVGGSGFTWPLRHPQK
jgi:hypothetical protein